MDKQKYVYGVVFTYSFNEECFVKLFSDLPSAKKYRQLLGTEVPSL